MVIKFLKEVINTLVYFLIIKYYLCGKRMPYVISVNKGHCAINSSVTAVTSDGAPRGKLMMAKTRIPALGS